VQANRNFLAEARTQDRLPLPLPLTGTVTESRKQKAELGQNRGKRRENGQQAKKSY